MMEIVVPGWRELHLDTLVFDYNGTLALDGKISAATEESLCRLAEQFEIHILTSDTFGCVFAACRNLPVTIKKLESEDHSHEKANYLEQLGKERIAAIGNGANDRCLVETAALGIVIIGSEGCSTETLRHADIAVNRIEDAFALFLNPKRLIATLRR